MMTGVPSGSAPAATADTAPSWPVSGSPTGVPSAVRHTRTVPSPPPLMMTGVPSGSAPAATAVTVPSWPVRTWWPVARRPWDQRVCQGRSGAAPAMRAARSRQPKLVGGQLELAGPHRRVEAGEEVGALPVHGGGGPRRGRSCGVEVGHQPGRIGGEQKPRILEQVVQLASLAGVQREVSPCVTVPAQRVGGGVGRDDRFMGLGRVDQEVGVLLRVDQEVGEGLVVHAKRAIRGRAVQELPGRARHLPDGGTGHRLLGKPASHQPELLSGEALVLGDGKRGENGPEPC